MMNEQLQQALCDVCYNELESIHESVMKNGGFFHSSQQIDDARDCVEIIDKLKKLSMK